MAFDAELSWSKLTPSPVIKHLKEHDDLIVFWNGVILPYDMAHCIAAEYIGVYVSKNVHQALNTRYKRLYYSNALGTRNWDHIVEQNSDLYTYLRSQVYEHMQKYCKHMSKKEVMAWFLTDDIME